MNKGKFKLWHAVLICLAVFVFFGALAAFTIRTASNESDGPWWQFFDRGLSFNVGGPHKSYEIDQTISYSSDEMESIDSISLGSVSTTVNVTTGGDALSARLYGSYSSRGELKLKTVHSGSNVKIYIDYSDARNVSRSNLQYDIVIPEGYMGALKVDSVSGQAKLEVAGLNLDELSAETVSGSINLSDVSATRGDLGSISGRITMDTIKNCESIHLSTTSGRITGEMLSGDIKANSVSGSIYLGSDCSGDMDIDSTSGRVEVTLPKDCDFSIDFNTTSGSFNCDAPLMVESSGRRHFKGTHGDGGANIKVNTVSGGCDILVR